jgi:hypothetical protein
MGLKDALFGSDDEDEKEQDAKQEKELADADDEGCEFC